MRLHVPSTCLLRSAPPLLQLGWLSGSIGAIEVHSRALTAAEIAAKYEGQSSRYSESLCSLEVPATGVSPPADQPSGSSPPADQPSGSSPPADQPSSTPPLPEQPGATPPPPPADQPSPSPPPPPTESPKPPSTLDSSTAAVSGSGASGSVANTLTMTGGEGGLLLPACGATWGGPTNSLAMPAWPSLGRVLAPPCMSLFSCPDCDQARAAFPPAELSGLQTDPVKQEQLKQAILASLNLPPGYTTDNIQINVVSVTQEGGRRRLQV